MARHGLGQRWLQRRFNQRQHGRSVRLRWQHDRYLYLHQHLCAIDHDLSGDIYGFSNINPNAYFIQLQQYR